MNWLDLIYLGIIFALSFYIYGIWEAGHFKRRGIKNIPFDFPVFGNMLRAFMAKEHFLDAINRVYYNFPDEKYVGFMQINRPLIMIKDLELIKQVTIKDFDNFLDHAVTIDEDSDPLFGKNLFSLRGDKWKDMRSTLSPAFTSSKMRNMFKLIDEIGKQMSNFYLKNMSKPENKERGLVEVEMKDAFTRYTNDVIATSAFGLTVDSLENPDNEFYHMGKVSSDFTGLQLIKFFGFSAFPKLMKLLGIQLFGKKSKTFFRSLVLQTMANREKHGTIRPDMIQLLMEAKKGSLKYEASSNESNDAGFATVEESSVGKHVVKRKWTEDDLVAQAILFFIAGFETASTLLCFLTHELTINPDIQKKLQNEFDDLISEKGPTPDYNDLMTLKYLDMVVTETLRRWPPAIATDRQCLRPYTLPPPNDSTSKGYTVQPGEGLWIPISAIHLDPKHYPNPEKFDPERFSEENKDNINPAAYIPFGIGPRNCIGSRFALMEAKIITFHLLANFNFVPTAKTENPIQLRKNTFNLLAQNGFWIGLQPRKQ